VLNHAHFSLAFADVPGDNEGGKGDRGPRIKIISVE
jgi:hypothetical protein